MPRIPQLTQNRTISLDIYPLTPLILTINPLQRAYVRYPPEGPLPPNLEELQEILKREKQQRK